MSDKEKEIRTGLAMFFMVVCGIGLYSFTHDQLALTIGGIVIFVAANLIANK